MVDLQEIYEDYARMEIPIFSYRAGPVGIASIEIKGNYAVFADFFQISSIPQLKLELMHELGHCATGCTHKLSSDFDLVERHEFRANKYAALRYAGPERFDEAFEAGLREPWELAEWLDLPEEFVVWALAYYRDNNLLRLSRPEKQEQETMP